MFQNMFWNMFCNMFWNMFHHREVNRQGLRGAEPLGFAGSAQAARPRIAGGAGAVRPRIAGSNTESETRAGVRN